MITFINVLLSLTPVVIFLIALVLLDSYKLVSIRKVIIAIVWGCLAAGMALMVNRFIITFIPHQNMLLTVLIAPIIEESLKAFYPLSKIVRQKVGFLVDGAIIGFAAGAGFAMVENLFFLQTLGERNVFVWLIRGLGTAVMHGGTTGILMIIVKYYLERRPQSGIIAFGLGLGAVFVIHAIFNLLVHIVSPDIIIITQLIVLPVLLSFAFKKSEKMLQNWLETGLADNIELLGDIRAGRFRETKAGHYLYSLKEHLAGEILADIFCFLQIYLELSARAKALLILKETGLQPAADPEIQAKFAELKQLEKNIGRTGRSAMAPLIRTNPRDLWQLYFLNQQ